MGLLSPHVKTGRRASTSAQGQLAVVLVVISTVLVTVSSVRYLMALVAAQQLQHDTAAGEVGWQQVLGKAEENMQEHLPHWIGHQHESARRSELEKSDAFATSLGGIGRQQKARADPQQQELQQPQQQMEIKLQNVEPQGAAKAQTEAKPQPKGGSQKPSSAHCRGLPNTDYNWGDPVGKWGYQHHVDTAEECCAACQNYQPAKADDMDCNVWVWCGDEKGCGKAYRECWTKHLAYPDAVAPREGLDVPWTSGLADPSILKADSGAVAIDTSPDRMFHTVISAEGTAVHWQARVGYYWFRKIKAQCETAGGCQMGGFTRILHSGQPDDLMDEIPSIVVDPLPANHDNKGYVVLNRPYAFVQWTQKARIKEKYVLMSEPDHVWLKPMPNLMKGDNPAAFPFFYIEPAKPENLHITEKFVGKLTRKMAENIAPIGNAPTMMRFDDLAKVAPLWMNTSLAIFYDSEANKEWGWVQEMYAFTIACYNAGLRSIGLHKKLMAQPPWDSGAPGKTPFYILHYTYGMDYTKDGEFTPGKYGEWRFDKRTYAMQPPPRHLGEPPPGMANELVRHLIHAINEATDAIPGWDEYAATGVATQHWDGVVTLS